MKQWLVSGKKRNYYFFYTLLFGFFFAVLYAHFFLSGKSLVWYEDGVRQHLNTLAYFGRWLRQILRTLAVEHRLSIPMWDMHIGYGSDIITTFHYYVIGDPLDLLSVFVPTARTEILYHVLIVLRLYLAGISFSIYCFYHKNPRMGVLLGSMMYVFAGWGIFACIRHPYFANPLIYLPLILMGIDKIYKKEKPHVFIWSVFVAAISNFYFFYMLCIFMFLYAAFQYFHMFSRRSVKDVLVWFGKFVGYYIIALMMAAVIFLPVIMTLFGTERFGTEYYLPALYELQYYERYLGNLLGARMSQWGITGFSAAAMAGVLVLFTKKKKYTHLKIGFLLLNLFLLIPYAGHVLNGFSYVGNRWIWALGMLICYMFVKAYQEMFTLTPGEKKKLLVMLLIYCILAMIPENARIAQNMIGLMLLACAVAVIVSAGMILTDRKYFCGALGVVMAASLIVNISYQYSFGGSYLREFVGMTTAMEQLYTPTDEVVTATGDTSVYRYDHYNSAGYCENSTLQTGTCNTGFYFSLANGQISKFFQEIYLNESVLQRYQNLDSRSILERLAAVKYFVVNEGCQKDLPYGYDKECASLQKGGNIYRAYGNDLALPLGYTYSSYIPREAYEGMTAAQKQEALLQGAVLEDSGLPETDVQLESREIKYKLKAGKGVTVEDGRIVTTGANQKIRLLFDGLPDSETYLVAENLQFDVKSPVQAKREEQWAGMSFYDKMKFLYQNIHWSYWSMSSKSVAVVSNGTVSKSVNILTGGHNGYNGVHNFLVNLGYQEEKQTEITVTLGSAGIYTFDDLKVVCQPVGHMDEQTMALGEEALTDIQMGVNEITGNISVTSPKALVFSIPYSRGFRVYVDGQEAELKQANTMYMAVELPEGRHQIRLSYCTPYIRAGALLSAAGLVFYVLLCLFARRRKNS